MKRLLFTLLCFGVLSTVTGCYVDPRTVWIFIR
jgi:hypothetical protein